MTGTDLIVLGGGPAGITVAVGCARAGRRVTLVERLGFGGELMNITGPVVGDPDPTRTGLDAANTLIEELMETDVVSKLNEATGLRFDPDERHWVVELDDGSTLTAPQVVLATGTRPRPLATTGAPEREGRGVSYCAPCDGPIFAGRPVAIVTGEHWAASEVASLAEVAASVLVIEPPAVAAGTRPGELANVEFATGELLEVAGDGRVERVQVRAVTGTFWADVAAVFGATGRIPNSELATGSVDLDPEGHVVADAGLATRSPGLFVVGELRAGAAQTVAQAIADGTALVRRLTTR